MEKLNNLKLNELRDAIFLSAEDLRKFKGGYAGLTYYSCNNGTTYIVLYATCYAAYDNPSGDPMWDVFVIKHNKVTKKRMSENVFFSI